MSLRIEIHQPISEAEVREYYLLKWKVLDEPMDIPWSEPIEMPNSHKLAVYQNGIIVAIRMIQFNSSQEVQIGQMATNSKFTGQGFGSKLISELEQIAISRDITRIILSTRDTAVPFYLKHGYHVISDLIHPMGIPCKRMGKDL